MTYLAEGSPERIISEKELTVLVKDSLGTIGRRNKVLLLPPDYSRKYSQAGTVARAAFDFYGDSITDIMPAIGTHIPMTESEISAMFGDLPRGLFRVHDWRGDVKTLGRIPAETVNSLTGFNAGYDWPAQVNRLIAEGGHDLIISAGQVVPHEVVGMANYNKNLFVGTGGAEAIHKSHYIGALYGMEKMMGRSDTPVRRLLNYASDNFTSNLPVLYILTVVSAGEDGSPEVKGLFIGDDAECYEKAAELSACVNITTLGRRLKRVAVYLPPESFKSTWIGNKAIYRSRMAIADGGELTVIAPGIKQFGEDNRMDRLIRKYGYRGTEAVRTAVQNSDDLKNSLGTAAHLIHGSSEGRFTIRYAAGGLSRQEIESVGFNWCSPDEAMRIFDPLNNQPGLCRDADGEEFYLIKNASIGLWTAEPL